MKSKLLVSIAIVSILSACATGFHRGVVGMKIDESNAHVGLDKDEVKAGDHVELYGNECRGAKDNRSCKKVSKGHGTVTEILSDNYVSVKFEPGVTFQEGDFVEKHAH